MCLLSFTVAAGPALAQQGAASGGSAAAPSPPGGAASRDRVARDLQERGKLEWSRKAYAEAAALLAASQEQLPMAGTSLLLADCYEHLGKLRSARDEFLRAEQLALATNNPELPERPRVLAERARLRAAALEPRVPYLELQVSEPLPGLSVSLNDVEVPSERWNTSLPLDAGAYRVEARATGYQPFETTVQVTNELAQRGQVVRVALEPMPRGSGERELAYWIGGAGAAVGLVGVALFIAAGAKKPSGCHPDQRFCETAKSRNDWNNARSLAQLATVSAAISVPLMAAGGVLYFRAEPGPDSVGAMLSWSGEF